MSNLTTVTGIGGITVTLALVGPQGAQGPAGDSILSGQTITPVLTTDQVAIVRNGVIYLATVSDVLAASSPSTDAQVTWGDGTNVTAGDGTATTWSADSPPSPPAGTQMTWSDGTQVTAGDGTNTTWSD